MKKALLLIINLLLFCFCENVSAQAWKKVIPLVSTCEQLKEVMPIKDCNTSYSRLDAPEYDALISYSSKTCEDGEQWNIPKGTVTSALFTLKPFMRLSAYDGNLKDYVMKPEDDLPDYKTYTNDTLGISLSVLLSESYGELIQDIFLLPSAENKNKFKCGKQILQKKTRPKKQRKC